MEPCTAEAMDPRIRRTRRLLRDALRALLKKKAFDEISVQDISEEATVNRATFYDHYRDKFALLESMVAERFHELLQEREVLFDGTCVSALKATVLAVCDYLAGVTAADGSRPLEPRMEAAVVAVLRRMFLEGIRRHPRTDGAAPEVVAAAAAWALYGAAKEWVQSPERDAPEEIADTVTRLVAPILQLPLPV
jgi:AcrR family transcriptional regulator